MESLKCLQGGFGWYAQFQTGLEQNSACDKGNREDDHDEEEESQERVDVAHVDDDIDEENHEEGDKSCEDGNASESADNTEEEYDWS